MKYILGILFLIVLAGCQSQVEIKKTVAIVDNEQIENDIQIDFEQPDEYQQSMCEGILWENTTNGFSMCVIDTFSFLSPYSGRPSQPDDGITEIAIFNDDDQTQEYKVTELIQISNSLGGMQLGALSNIENLNDNIVLEFEKDGEYQISSYILVVKGKHILFYFNKNNDNHLEMINSITKT